jgi:predicted TIM-barrel fold metal-dependent hydrolase
MIIDAHCHAGTGDLLTAPWNTCAPLRVYLGRARAAAIDLTIVVPAFRTDHAKANAELALIVQRHSPRLIGFAFVHCTKDAGRIREIVGKAVNNWGFRGIKVHGSEAMPSREVCDTARALHVPILVDVVGRPYVVDMFAPQYPDVNFIVAHLGSFADDWRAHQQVIDQLVRHPNVFSDTSGVRRFEYIVQAVKRAGPHKLLFGSDGPWLHPGLELYKIRLLGLSPERQALITGGNARRILRRQPLDSLV